MKPAAFDYHRVDRVEDAHERLADLGEDAKVLAGGQSLVPMMNFRLVRPPASTLASTPRSARRSSASSTRSTRW